LTLVERAVRSLLARRLERVLVVVGHDAGPVAAVVGRLGSGRVRAVCGSWTGPWSGSASTWMSRRSTAARSCYPEVFGCQRQAAAEATTPWPVP
jgi:CTP:molybdopterin cytidylyltransferase MocA